MKISIQLLSRVDLKE